MSKLMDSVKAKIAKLDNDKAAEVVRAEREKANLALKTQNAEVQELTELLRMLEPQVDREARKARGKTAFKVGIRSNQS